jgi:hypothetical protein
MYKAFMAEDGNPRVEVAGIEKTIGESTETELKRLIKSGENKVKRGERTQGKIDQLIGYAGLLMKGANLRKTEIEG